jgi:thiamine biosynthesis lipoprotein
MITVLNLIQIAAVCLLALDTVPEPGLQVAVLERRTFLMGTLLEARVEARGRDDAMAAIEAVFDEVARLEGVLSSWTSSEITDLNQAPVGVSFELSPELACLLAEARGWSLATQGAFDPGVGALLDVWGFRDGEARHPDPAELAGALAATATGAVVVDEHSRTAVRISDHGWIDTGAFGKGAALRNAGRVLREHGIREAVLDFGGQLLIRSREPVRVAVAHPAVRDSIVGWFSVSEGSVATSGQSERFVEIEGKRYGHIIDPRSGMPAEAWGSVTVIAEDPLVADVLATALYVMGPQEGRRWAEKRSDIAVLFVDHSEGELGISWTPPFERLAFNFEH